MSSQGPLLQLVVDRSQSEIVLEGLERRLDLDQLNVEPPQLGGVFPGQIGAEQITAFASARLPQLPAGRVCCARGRA